MKVLYVNELKLKSSSFYRKLKTVNRYVRYAAIIFIVATLLIPLFNYGSTHIAAQESTSISPYIRVYPQFYWISGENWPLGEIKLEIWDNSSKVYEASTTSSNTEDEDGYFGFSVTPFELTAGLEVIVKTGDDEVEKTHIIKDLEITSVNVDEDKVIGRAGEDVDKVFVGIRGMVEENVPAESTNGLNWEADFSGVGGIDYATVRYVGAREYDDEENFTYFHWPIPFFFIDHQNDDLWGYAWIDSTPINVTIKYKGGGEDTFDIITVDQAEFWVNIRHDYGYQVGIGDELELTQGDVTLTHEVMNLTVDEVSVANDRISGTAEPGSEVSVEIHGHEPTWHVVKELLAVADSSGNWTAAFEPGDITFGINGSAEQSYDCQASTRIHWFAQSFPDVSPDFQFYGYIEAIYAAGITTGYSDGTFRPYVNVSRGQMAAFLARALGLDTSNPPATPSFPDVSPDFQFYPYIEAIYAAGITTGYSDGTYRPYVEVSRGQMAAFLARAVGLDTSNPPATPSFPDVSPDFQFYGYIEAIYAEGITTGYSDGTYQPYTIVTRGQMAAFLARAFLGAE